MSSHRLERVRELLKREVGEAIRREMPVAEAGVVTVNEIEVSGDLRQATAYVSMFGSTEQKKTGLRLLEKCRPRIQDHIAKAVILKYIPTLRFVADDSIDRGNRVLSILDQLEHESPDKSRQ
jgi:ribosome-binding factor A